MIASAITDGDIKLTAETSVIKSFIEKLTKYVEIIEGKDFLRLGEKILNLNRLILLLSLTLVPD